MPGTMAATAAAAARYADNGDEDEDSVPIKPSAPHATPPGWFLESKRREGSVPNGASREPAPGNAHAMAARHESMAHPDEKTFV